MAAGPIVAALAGGESEQQQAVFFGGLIGLGFEEAEAKIVDQDVAAGLDSLYLLIRRRTTNRFAFRIRCATWARNRFSSINSYQVLHVRSACSRVNKLTFL